MLTTILDFISVITLWLICWVIGLAANGTLIYALCILLGFGDIRMRKVYLIAGLLSALTLVGMWHNGVLTIAPYRG